MPVEIAVPKYKRDPNAKVESLYSGVGQWASTITRLVKPSADGKRMEATITRGPGLQRGQGGRIGILVLGGMETTLDEMEYILEAKRQQKFVPRRGSAEIAQMGRLLIERRNQQVEDRRKHLQGNPSERPKRRIRLHLPVGFRYVPTSEPGLRILTRA